jgi:acyl phosphate:glycerol-3-phosphate acyltransferase
MTGLAVVAGYLIGATPTASWLGRAWGVDLRAGGSKNPGANNARRLGGYRLAAAVLVIETVKGAAAVAIGWGLGGEWGAAAAGLAAVAGNVYNVWHRFSGGKGLSICFGVLLAAWPLVVPAIVATIGLVSWITRSSGRAAMATLFVLCVAAFAWGPAGLGTAWGVTGDGVRIGVALGISAILLQKHLYDALHPLSRSVPDRHRG